MKESTLIVKLKQAEQQRLQNNQMVMALTQDVAQLQEFVSGFFKVVRRLPGYEEIIKELAAEHKAAEEKAAAEAKELEVTDPEEVKPTLDLTGDDSPVIGPGIKEQLDFEMDQKDD